MVVLKLMDGLGNQMFQYAYARWLQYKFNDKIYLDTLKLGKGFVRSYGLGAFCLNDNVFIPSRRWQWLSRIYTKILRLTLNRVFGVSLLTEHGWRTYIRWGYYTTNQYIKYQRTPLDVNHKIKFVRGYFQSAKWFSEIGDILSEEFAFKSNDFPPCVKELHRRITSCQSVCVHIRRGDYTNTVNKFTVCNEKYYKEAMARISGQLDSPAFFVFSNTPSDLEWIRKNYDLKGNVEYVNTTKNEFEDFFLMSSCRHFVISNSTFSWWAAYLAENKDKRVYAPSPWVKSNEEFEDIYCEGWNIIKVL